MTEQRTDSNDQRRRGSLRWRLTAGVLTLSLIVMATIGVATLLTLRAFLMQQLDAQLLQTAGQVVGRSFSDVRGLPEGTLLVQVSPSGTLLQPPALVIGRGRDDRNAQLSDPDLAALQRTSLDPTQITLSSLGAYRVVSLVDAAGNRTIVAASTQTVTQTLRRLLAIQLVALALAAVGLTVATYAFIRRELLPLERVAATARRVSKLPLSNQQVELTERVDESGAPTEVADVALAFNDMLAHVDYSLQERAASELRLRHFLADASHELRTPLVSIRGYAELYRRSDVDPEQRDNAMARIESEAGRMGVLVDDLLLLARLDQGRPLLNEAVDLTQLVVESVADAQVAAGDHRFVLNLTPEPVVVRGDADRLHQVLVNLLANATRHTPPGTTVTVLVDATAPWGRVSVHDDGPGIPDDLQPHVFERFTRADGSRARSIGGSGLGLSIVAAVIQALDGEVSLDSNPGSTKITVTLPLDTTAAEESP